MLYAECLTGELDTLKLVKAVTAQIEVVCKNGSKTVFTKTMSRPCTSRGTLLTTQDNQQIGFIQVYPKNIIAATFIVDSLVIQVISRGKYITICLGNLD